MVRSHRDTDRQQDGIKKPRAAGRPRNESVRQSVLEAAYAILVEGGLNQFTTEGVAAKSGIARSTIYRWWPSKGLLAIESFLDAFRPQLTYVHTNNAVEDFRNLVQSLAKALSGPAGKIASSVVAEAQRDPETRRLFVETFSEPLRQESAQIVRRGIEQGVFRKDLDIWLLLDAVVGAIYLRLLLGLPLDPIWSASLCHTLLKGSERK